jgi:hypothetical protein
LIQGGEIGPAAAAPRPSGRHGLTSPRPTIRSGGSLWSTRSGSSRRCACPTSNFLRPECLPSAKWWAWQRRLWVNTRAISGWSKAGLSKDRVRQPAGRIPARAPRCFRAAARRGSANLGVAMQSQGAEGRGSPGRRAGFSARDPFRARGGARYPTQGDVDQRRKTNRSVSQFTHTPPKSAANCSFTPSGPANGVRNRRPKGTVHG